MTYLVLYLGTFKAIWSMSVFDRPGDMYSRQHYVKILSVT